MYRRRLGLLLATTMLLAACGGGGASKAPSQRDFGDIWSTHEKAEKSTPDTYLTVSMPQHIANCWAAIVTDTEKYDNVVFERDGKVVDVYTAGTSMTDDDILQRAGCK